MSYLNFKLKNCLIKSTCCNKSVVIKIGSDEISDSNNKEEIKEMLYTKLAKKASVSNIEIPK